MAAAKPNADKILRAWHGLREQGHTNRQIADIVGMSPSGLSHFLSRRGLTKDFKRRDRSIEKLTACDLIRRLAKNVNLSAIARETEYDETTLRSWKYGDSTPPDDALPILYQAIGEAMVRIAIQGDPRAAVSADLRTNTGIHTYGSDVPYAIEHEDFNGAASAGRGESSDAG